MHAYIITCVYEHAYRNLPQGGARNLLSVHMRPQLLAETSQDIFPAALRQHGGSPGRMDFDPNLELLTTTEFFCTALPVSMNNEAHVHVHHYNVVGAPFPFGE